MPYEYTPTGVSHVFNAQTKNVLSGLDHFYPEYCTSKEIAEYIGQPVQLVRDVLKRWFKYDYRFASRRKIRGSSGGAYKYCLKSKGKKALIQFEHRQNLGFDLNRNRLYPLKVDKYVIVNKKPKGRRRKDMSSIEDTHSDFNIKTLVHNIQ